MKYPALLKKQKESFLVTFRDIPEALTEGATYEEAIEMAEDALITAMDFYFEDNREIPKPSKAKKDEILIELPLSVATKVLLLNTLIQERVSQTELAKRMGIKPQQVTRIVNLEHKTRIDTVQEAFKALGRTVDIKLEAG